MELLNFLHKIIFFGKIQGINDLVTFEQTLAEELSTIFEETITDYLETCKSLNKDLNKIFKVSFNVRVSQELH